MARPTVAVLDYGSGNLRSAQRALSRAGAEVIVTADLGVARSADGLVVPGVGAFAACMAGIAAVSAQRVIVERVAAQRPVLGICVGMQVLFDTGVEHGVETPGLGLLPGVVRRLRAVRVPHMGWNTVTTHPGSRLFAGVEHERFYFVHSYAAEATVGALSTTEHGQVFVAAVEHGALAATQFHPEKSGDAGAALLANWVGLL
ncbi:MAG: imidazole glycerol phosphate synthase subunit HisH [Mycobacteriales bacterium]